jgi:sodium/proline symporter
MQLILVGFIVYFVIIGVISLITYVRAHRAGSASYSHAILGNRSVNYVMTALSAHASDMSDWLFMAFPALLYGGGLINAWLAIGLVVGMLASWHFVAPGLRRATEKYNCMTLSSYFEQRFHDKSGAIRVISACMSLFFFAIYIAAGLKGFGFLSQSIFNIPYIIGTLLAVLCATTYIALGGYRTLAWIDSFQALFLLSVIFIVPIFGYKHVGGWSAIVTHAQLHHISLAFWPTTLIGMINTLLMATSWGLGYFGTPHILTKFMGISNVQEMAKAKYVGVSWQIAVLTAAGMSGLIGIAYFPTMLANKELVFIEMVKDLFNPLTTGFILSAVAGATLSVIAAQMLVVISVITEDFYRPVFRPHANNKELIYVYRASVLIIALLSFCVSLDKTTTIQSLVQYAWMGFACSFSPLVLLSLYGTRINKYGACASIIIGGIIAAFWHFVGRSVLLAAYGLDIPAVVPGFLLSIVGAYLVSYATKELNK